ncbi:glycosyltransferase family 34 protein [Babjeviella inositovora NRRL Y-12698]|uniref:Glycosyltransferase family 34 protein n=1 Tax=Babjeviella inositovora NRRL Y-12698 TaxID=984486 RepID=A0A1E3QXD0_9ASCO|nr:glycosyltransferase family 34 protein [Babjeviella inositovora NRRL Y-12698]ODQ82306.1 glycosyltransferase family 34 protein [Babjeviella inositovora NRRL Y-12698]
MSAKPYLPVSEDYKPSRSFAQKAKDFVRFYRKTTILLLSIITLSFFTLDPLRTLHITDAKVVIILAANEGGGVLKWKGPQDWSIERSSIANKRDYAQRHGYALTIKDMTLKRRYSHEWRESWEKVDILKQTMRQYPKAEWFWWVDLHTFIMEPQISLEQHIFSNLENNTYRSLNYFNPLKLDVDVPYVDYTQPIDMLITQDCGGFNLGSFMMRRSPWTELLLDAWWDPAFYEQKHMEWEHKEQDCLESLFDSQAWIRERIGFLPLRKINAFPPGACADSPSADFFYDEKARDFMINMAGCQWGRDCWGEMENYKNLSKKLHAGVWYKPWLYFR